MKVNQLLNKIKDKWHIKILCILIASALYVMHQNSLLDKKTFVIPLTVIENGKVINVGEIPSSIAVTVQCGTGDMAHISAYELHAYIRLDNLEGTGEYQVPVNITVSERVKEMSPLEIKYSPDVLNVKVEELGVKYIPLEANIVGQVANGYRIENVLISPSTVEVRGPKSAVEGTDKLYTSRVNVSNAGTNFSVEADYLQIDKRLDVKNQGPYRVTVKVVPISYQKQFNNIPVKMINIPEYLESDGDETKVDIMLGGDMPVLEKYNLPENAVYVDLKAVTEPGKYDLPVQIKIPGTLSVERLSSERVWVNVVEKMIESETEESNDENENINESQGIRASDTGE